MTRAVMALTVGLLATAGCTSTDLLTVQDAPIFSTPSFRIPDAIEAGLAERGWQVAGRRPGAIDAVLMVREHRADITVVYDADSYSIQYRDSQNLNYRNGRIHRNYNRWVANLNTDIQRALASTGL
jgi:hypothetical protein